MSIETIQLEIEDQEFECEVEFDFTPGEQAITHLLPEDCHEGSQDYWEVVSLMFLVKEFGGTKQHNITFMVDDLHDCITDKLKELRS